MIMLRPCLENGHLFSELESCLHSKKVADDALPDSILPAAHLFFDGVPAPVNDGKGGLEQLNQHEYRM